MKTPFHLILLKAFHAQRNRVRPSMAEIGLSPGQPKILSHLASHDRREPAQGDKRAGCVSITDKGRALQAQARTRFEEIVARELDGFSEREKTEFTSYLCRMYKNLTGREME